MQTTIEKLVYRLSKLKNLCAEDDEKSESGVAQVESRPKLRDRHLNLEKRLHQCWLRSLERQFILEGLLQKSSDNVSFKIMLGMQQSLNYLRFCLFSTSFTQF